MTYTAVDIHNNELSGSFDVTITDDENPTISGLSGDLASTNDAGACGAVMAWRTPQQQITVKSSPSRVLMTVATSSKLEPQL